MRPVLTSRSPIRTRIAAMLTAAAAAVGLSLISAAVAGATTPPPTPKLVGAGAVKTVAYGSYRIAVPKSWPVRDLSRAPTTCVRFDVHAVYLGHPGADQACPAHLIGRTESVLIEPLDAVGRTHIDPSLVDSPDGASAGGTGAPFLAQRLVPSAGVLVTASFNRASGLIQRMLDGAVTVSGASATGRAPTDGDLAPAVSDAAPAASGAGPSADNPVPGSAGDRAEKPAAQDTVDAPAPDGAGKGAGPIVVTGRGFDTCASPSLSALHAWDSSPYRSVGVYIGGGNRACAFGNLNPAWVSGATSAGWSLLPLYVGPQAPCVPQPGLALIAPRTAAAQGSAAADDAVRSAQSLGMDAGSTLYYDMEGYGSDAACRGAVLAFLSAWTSQLHQYGYRSGVYSSADSGIADLAHAGGGTVEPDAVWIARWNGQAIAGPDPVVPNTMWATHQRVHQYTGSRTETYGGITLSIDADAVDGPVAAVGSAAAGGPEAPALTYDLDGSHLRIYRWASTGRSFVGPTATTDVALPAGAVAERAVIGDFSGAGRQDLALVDREADGTARIRVWLDGIHYQGDAGWFQGDAALGAAVGSGRVAAGDFDGSGRDGIAAVTDDGAGGIRILRWTSTGGSFQQQPSSDVPGLPFPWVAGRVVAGDFTGTGHDDLLVPAQLPDGTMRFVVVPHADGTPAVWYHSGTFPLSHAAGRIVAGDFTGTGRDGVAALVDDGNGAASLWRWDSTGSAFVGGPTWTSRGGYYLSQVGDTMTAGDVTGSGRDAVVTAYQYGGGGFRFHVWLDGAAYQGDSGWYSSGVFPLDRVGGRIVTGRW